MEDTYEIYSVKLKKFIHVTCYTYESFLHLLKQKSMAKAAEKYWYLSDRARTEQGKKPLRRECPGIEVDALTFLNSKLVNPFVVRPQSMTFLR